jgi:COP9 signalosome complex subunit 1
VFALNELSHTYNIKKYVEVREKYEKECLQQGKPINPADRSWIDTNQKFAHSKTDKLETELKTYKNNLIKESIRVSIMSHFIRTIFMLNIDGT